jgi:hypothetical protein
MRKIRRVFVKKFVTLRSVFFITKNSKQKNILIYLLSKKNLIQWT